MIEVIYDKDKENKGEQGTEKEGQQEFKMPKNIRQMGTPNPSKRIYIEDYVVTYLNYISRPGSTHARGAILLGNVRKTENGMIIFISGAVDAQSIEFDLDEDTFSKEIWTGIYKEIKESFPELSVVGWFLSRMGFTTATNDKISKLHIDNFPGSDKVLYIYDSLDDDEAFYLFERGELRKQKGYYIYYAQNQAMQDYIIRQKGDVPEEKESKIAGRDNLLLKNFREKNEKYKPVEKKKTSPFVYAAGSAAVVALLAVGVSVINNYDKMKDMEISINRLELTSGETPTEDDVAAAAVLELTSEHQTEQEEGSEAGEENSQEQSSETEDTAVEDNENAFTEADTENEEASSNGVTDTVETGEAVSSDTAKDGEQSLPVMTDGNPTYYEIQPGDTLTSISVSNYNSIQYIDAIAEANDMDVEDKIYAGQKIILPSID
jgi:LysM repeat protein